MNSIMEIKQKSRKDKMVTLYDRIEARTAEQTLKKIVEINMEDESYINEGKEWAHQNMVEGATFKLTPISLYLSTPGGNVYDGLALYDTIESSTTPVEIICSGKVMSMGIIVCLASSIRKALRSTTFMIHQVSGMIFGTLQDMKESVEETNRLNEIIFDIIVKKSKVTREKLDCIIRQKEDWYFSAEEALNLGIITEIID